MKRERDRHEKRERQKRERERERGMKRERKMHICKNCFFRIYCFFFAFVSPVTFSVIVDYVRN